jgi:hypothetical protein
MARRKNIYALYKGDTWITDGTKEEIAKFMKVSVKTIMFYKSKQYAKRCPDSYKLIFVQKEDHNENNTFR